LMFSRIRWTFGLASSLASASLPPAKPNESSPSRICLRERRVIGSSKSLARRRRRGFEPRPWSVPSCLRSRQPRELRLQIVEIDRLCDELDSAEFAGASAPLVIAIGREQSSPAVRASVVSLAEAGSLRLCLAYWCLAALAAKTLPKTCQPHPARHRPQDDTH
jgi:hypothetical protein